MPIDTERFLSGVPSSLPVIHVRGNHYETGYEMGRIMKGHIQEFYRKFKPLHLNFLPFIQTGDGRQVYEGYLSIVSKTFPQYLEEMRGLADGSHVTFQQVFIMHIRSELALILNRDDLEPPACTTVMLNYPETQIVGHAEDNDPSMAAYSYIVQAEIVSQNLVDGYDERFTAFCYPGMLPGNAFAFNSGGLVFAANAKFTSQVPHNKIPRHVLCRALLAANSSGVLENILRISPGLAEGCSLNLALTNEVDRRKKFLNYELHGTNESTNTIIDCAHVLPYSSDDPHVEGNGFYYHFNKYERIQAKQVTGNVHVISSVHRQNRARQMAPPRTLGDVLNFLGDTQDPDYPIFRRPNHVDTGATLAVAIFDLLQKTLTIYRGNPKTSRPLLVIPMT